MHEWHPASPDTVDVADVVRTVRRHAPAVYGFLAFGLAVAVLVILFAPRRFAGRATLLAKASASGGASISGRIQGVGDLLGGLGQLSGASGLETELQILRSRALAGQVVDSLRLQFRVKDPEGMAPARLVEALDVPGPFRSRTLRLERAEGGSYVATWKGSTLRFTPGAPTQLDIGAITLRRDGLPMAFTVVVMDREDAITRFSERLEVTKSGGDIAKIVYRGDDSVSAAAGANSLVAYYLQRRKTIDRGVNERSVEYVTAQVDSTLAALAETERSLRKYQEASGVIDPEVVGRVEIQSSAELRQRLTDLQVDEATITQLLSLAQQGRITSRDLAAYPGFLRASTVAPLVSQLGELEARRIRLMEDRTEKDPEVVALDKTTRAVEANIVATARSFAGSISQQRSEVQARVDRMQRAIMEIPAATERGGRLKRDVERMTAILTALQAQLIEARLGAIGEGGEIRQVDAAVPQRLPAFPKPLLTLAIGAAGGLFCGVVAALLLGWFGRWLRDPIEIERAVGVTAQRIEPHAPLLITGATSARTLLVIPLDGRADAGAVVERLARTAAQRSLQPTVVDLSASMAAGNGRPATGPQDADATIDRHEQNSGGMVIVRLPVLASEATAAALRESRPVLLVAPPGPVDRVRLASAVDTLRRLGVPCAGVVMSEATPRALR